MAKFPDLKDSPRSREALDRLVQATIVYWNDLEDWLFDFVIKSMPRRMKTGIDLAGWSTKY